LRILHQRSTDALLALSLTVFICSTGWRGTSSTSQAQAKGTRHRIAFNRIGPRVVKKLILVAALKSLLNAR